MDRDQRDPILAARHVVGADFSVVVDLVGGRLLAASVDVIADGGRKGAIVDLTGDLDAAIDRDRSTRPRPMRPLN